MKRAFIISLLAALALYLGWRFAWPYIDTRPEQDACEFGPVSNARYRGMLAEARKRSKTIWPPLTGNQLDQGDNLRNRIADLTAGMTSLEERIAGVHAVMRDIGAFHYRKAGAGPNYGEIELTGNPEFPLGERGGFGLSYLINSTLLGVFDPVHRYAYIGVSLPLVVRTGDKYRSDLKRPPKFNEFQAVVLHPSFPSWVIGYGGVRTINIVPEFGVEQAPCPPLPPEEWLGVYRRWQAIQEKDQAQ